MRETLTVTAESSASGPQALRGDGLSATAAPGDNPAVAEESGDTHTHTPLTASERGSLRMRYTAEGWFTLDAVRGTTNAPRPLTCASSTGRGWRCAARASRPLTGRYTGRDGGAAGRWIGAEIQDTKKPTTV